MRKLLAAIAFVCLSSFAFGQTAAVTGHLVDPGNSTVGSRTFERAELKNTGGQQCRVNGTGLLVPTLRDYTPNSVGLLSFTIFRTDNITCGSQTGLTQWAFTIWRDGKPQPSCFTPVVAATINLDTLTCANTNAVVIPPAGDTVYARLDGGNQPFTGLIVANAGEKLIEQAAPSGVAGASMLWDDSTLHRLRMNNNNASAVTIASLNDNLGQFNATTSAQLAGVVSDETGSGLLVFGTAPIISPYSLTGIKIIDGIHYANTDVGIQAAITDCAGSCIIWIVGSVTIGSTVNVNQSNIEIRGFGNKSSIVINCNCDAFNVTGDYFVMDDLTVNYSLTTTRTGKSLMLLGANNGNVRNVMINGNATSPNNGSLFKETGTFGAWTWENVFLTEGPLAFWENFISVVNNSGGATAASYNFVSCIGGGKFLSPAILLDGAIDTFIWTGGGLDGAVGTTANMIAVRNTVSGFIDPRWVHFFGVSMEGGGVGSTVTMAQVDNVRDFQYNGYVAGAQVGFAFGAGVVGASVHDTLFVFIGQSAVTVASGGAFTNIHNNYFDDTADQTNNTFDTISLAANAGNSTIMGNTWRNLNANKPRYGINIIAGTGHDIQVAGNVMGGVSFGTATVNNAGTGNNINIWESTAATQYLRLNPNILVNSAGTNILVWGTSVMRFSSGYNFGFSSNVDAALAVADAGFKRVAANVIATTTDESGTLGGEMRSARISATYNASGTQQTAVHLVQDSCTLGTNCAVTLTGSAAYTNSSSYHCTADDATGIFAVRVNQTSGSAVTFTGTGTDVINYSCIGN